MDTSTNYRLPRNIVPNKYEIRLRPDFQTFSFEGRVSIQVSVTESTNSIVLNAAELEIGKATIAQAGKTLSCTINLDTALERATLTADGTLNPGEARLEIDFKGTLNDQLSGFYRSKFVDDQGQDSFIATTQFEATDARKAFPCFDEPDLKAVFSVELDAPVNYLAISNAPEKNTVDLGDGYKRVTFADTIAMSTYLVAFIVGPLEASEPYLSGETPIRIISKPGQSHLQNFAKEVAAHALEFFTNWFSIPYPGQKLDLIAIPDFAFGAMENLGAVTFRETLLLVDPEKSSRPELERIVDVISHEIAHMWFGDLVTMKWWNGLWLNEAFATFMELLATDHFNPSWNRWVSFGLSKGAAFATDGLHNTRPIEFNVVKPSDAEGMFDVLTYEKGASVLRMLERYLSPDIFRAGITNYLNSHKFANAETTDLWNALEKASSEPIAQTMVDWVFQGGYPIIRLTSNGTDVTITQEPFSYLSDPSKAGVRGGQSEIGSAWKVPMNIRIGNTERKFLLDAEPVSISLENPDDLVIANAGGWGFFRVSYDRNLLGRVLSNFSRLTDLEKFNLASDIWAQTISLRTNVGSFFELVEAIKGESDPNLWQVIISAFSLIDLMAPKEMRDNVAERCRIALAPILEKVGFEAEEGEAEGTSKLRSAVIEAMGTIGHDAETIADCKDLFVKEMSIESNIDPDIVSAVLGVVAANGDEAEFAFILDRYRHPSTPQEENRYLMALTRFEHPELIKKVLSMTLSEIRSQNGPFVIANLLTGRESGPLAWHFIAQNWDTLLERFPDNTIPRMLSGITGLVSDDSYYLEREIRSFFETHTIPTGEKSLGQTLERYAVNLAFRRTLLDSEL
ncbi:MAG: M1 family metallopeptidase [Actinomycetota bacterium]|nr:M1 family metallopeptidase [Actinomycetota bacterium]